MESKEIILNKIDNKSPNGPQFSTCPVGKAYPLTDEKIILKKQRTSMAHNGGAA